MSPPVAGVTYNMTVCFLFHIHEQDTCQHFPEETRLYHFCYIQLFCATTGVHHYKLGVLQGSGLSGLGLIVIYVTDVCAVLPGKI